MKRNSLSGLVLDLARASLLSSAGGVLLRQSAAVTGVDRELSSALARWRGSRAVHDSGRVVLGVATSLALGGDCPADVAVIRAQAGLFGSVASDPTVSRLVATLAADVEVALPAIRAARATARERAWGMRRPLGGVVGGRDGGQVIVDLDSTIVIAHSDKQGAEPTHKRTFGFSPMCVFVDHGPSGTGEVLALDLRPGSASPWKAADHITALDDALAQLPAAERTQVLVRTDAGGCSKAFLHRITEGRVGVLDRVLGQGGGRCGAAGDPRTGVAGRDRRGRRAA